MHHFALLHTFMFTCTVLNKQPLYWAYVHFQTMLNAALRGCVETCQTQHLSHQEEWNHSNHTYPQRLTSKSVKILNIVILGEHCKPCCWIDYRHIILVLFIVKTMVVLQSLVLSDLHACTWSDGCIYGGYILLVVSKWLFYGIFSCRIFSGHGVRSVSFVCAGYYSPLLNMICTSFYMFNEEIQNMEVGNVPARNPTRSLCVTNI